MTSRSERDGKLEFERYISELRSELPNLGAHLTIDTSARTVYIQQVGELARRLRTEAVSGRITWECAAAQAQEARNAVMQLVRKQSTPVGRAIAQRLKAKGRNLNELVALHSKRIFGAAANFEQLSSSQKNRIFASIVVSAGKTNPSVSKAMNRLSHAGRGLLILSLSISVYNVVTAEDKVQAGRRELASTSAGIAGGVAGGALAGLACGPGAPVCVTLGAFVGGALAALGIGRFC